MRISMCACGSPACKHCNPNIWTNPHSEVNTSEKDRRIQELEQRVKALETKLELTDAALAGSCTRIERLEAAARQYMAAAELAMEVHPFTIDGSKLKALLGKGEQE